MTVRDGPESAVVPKSKRDDAKKFISVTGVRARIAFYEMDGEEVKSIQYE
jgi:hypothetical protein